MVMIFAHIFDKTGFEKLEMKKMTGPIILLTGLDIYLVYYYITTLKKLGNFKFEDVLTLDWVLMIVSAAFLVLILVFGWLKKPELIKGVLIIEIALSVCCIYGNSFMIPNKNDTFEEMYSINDVLEETLAEDDESFYRVYVELEAFDVEPINFNRMTVYPTNTEIFHSWTDNESDELATLLFNLSQNLEEHQSKKKLNIMALYLNQFLGYKYILTSAEHDYYLDSECFELIYSDTDYALYRITYAEPFQVYNSYTSYSDYEHFRDRNNFLISQQILLETALIDEERYADADFNLDDFELTGTSTEKSLYPTTTITSYEKLTFTGTGSDTDPNGTYFRFGGEALDIAFDAGALYIEVNNETFSDQVYMEFADGSFCKSNYAESDDYEVKCEFGSEPVAIYFETTGISNHMTITYRMEMARDGAAYLVYDLSEINYTSDSGMLYLSMGQEMEDVIFVDAEGNETYGFTNCYFFDTPPVRAYIYKTGNMYNKVSNLFGFALKYVYDADYLDEYESLTNGDKLYDSGNLVIENGHISLSYHSTDVSGYDQLVVIPITYSEEWTVVSDQDYETISASGGMLGIIIPAGTENVTVELKFVPKGLKEGSLASAGALVAYLGIFLPGWIIRKKKKKQAAISEEMGKA